MRLVGFLQRVSMGACAIGSMTVHQEYVCEDCQHEFTALFALVGCYAGHPDL
ncbi:transposase-like protein [Paraburkholderia sp. GAS334]